MYSIDNDLKLRERAQRAFPGGVYGHQASASLSPMHPQFFTRAEGPYWWDTDDNQYIDFMCGYGTNLLGYCHPKVDAAALKQQAIVDAATGPSSGRHRRWS
ncbi:hypothetical protein A3709_00090 [Halioglobus sp. HI00S01]|uniref:aminotransferase class III-fold pyridoxal phosphate-dependent enzyme n=1 Tax=Halioglobus sp. HI00S01 TaxID=1822214 RepID=UPI0007C2573C|nr:aminotransferase class III-fold pyridoxal phosphate-dependent enzyme [Halioglobus sp. HI00S01]KZX60514.1 hypothetical protein A3709_00090 [Halioglobus sp. HI00S01]